MSTPSQESRTDLALLQKMELELFALFQDKIESGVPEEAGALLLSRIEQDKKTVPASCLWALGLECLSDVSSRPFADSLPRWTSRVRTPKGIRSSDAASLVAVAHRSPFGDVTVVWLANCRVPAIAAAAWKEAVTAGYGERLTEIARHQTLELKDRLRQLKLFHRTLKAFRRMRHVDISADNLAHLLLALQKGIPSTRQPDWIDTACGFTDIHWAGRFLAAVATHSAPTERLRLLEGCARTASFGVGLKTLVQLTAQGASATEGDLKVFLGQWPTDRAQLLLLELIRFATSSVSEDLLLSLARLLAQSNPAVDPTVRQDSMDVLGDTLKTVACSPATKEAVLATIGRGSGTATRESSTELDLAQDVVTPEPERLAAAARVLEVDAEQYLDVAAAIAGVSSLESHPILKQLLKAAQQDASRTDSPTPFFALLRALRRNPRAVQTSLEFLVTSERFAAIADAITDDWERQHSGEDPWPSDWTELCPRFRDSLATRVAQRLVDADPVPLESPLLHRLADIVRTPTELASLLLGAFRQRLQSERGEAERQARCLRQEADLYQTTVRATADREREQALLDLLPAASAVHDLQCSDSSADASRPISDAWASFVDYYARHRCRLFPDSQTVPYDPRIHEFRGDRDTPAAGDQCRVAQLGLEGKYPDGWRCICRAIVL